MVVIRVAGPRLEPEACAYYAAMQPVIPLDPYKNITTAWRTLGEFENADDLSLTKEMILLFAHEAHTTLEDKIYMMRGFLKEHFVDHGIFCKFYIHAPHHKESDHTLREAENHPYIYNWHAHVIMTVESDKIFLDNC